MWSIEAVTSRLASGVKHMSVRWLVCPSSLLTSFRVARSYSRTTLSSHAKATRSVSRTWKTKKATSKHRSSNVQGLRRVVPDSSIISAPTAGRETQAKLVLKATRRTLVVFLPGISGVFDFERRNRQGASKNRRVLL